MSSKPGPTAAQERAWLAVLKFVLSALFLALIYISQFISETVEKSLEYVPHRIKQVLFWAKAVVEKRASAAAAKLRKINTAFKARCNDVILFIRFIRRVFFAFLDNKFQITPRLAALQSRITGFRKWVLHVPEKMQSTFSTESLSSEEKAAPDRQPFELAGKCSHCGEKVSVVVPEWITSKLSPEEIARHEKKDFLGLEQGATLKEKFVQVCVLAAGVIQKSPIPWLIGLELRLTLAIYLFLDRRFSVSHRIAAAMILFLDTLVAVEKELGIVANAGELSSYVFETSVRSMAAFLKNEDLPPATHMPLVKSKESEKKERPVSDSSDHCEQSRTVIRTSSLFLVPRSEITTNSDGSFVWKNSPQAIEWKENGQS